MRNLESVVQKYFPNAKENKPGEYKTLCMCHDDTSASLGITITNDKIKVNCFSCNAGLSEVCAKVGAKQEEFFKYDKKEIIKNEVQQEPITVESYAKYVNLPVDFLVKEFDIQNDEAYFNCKNNPSISFPYFKTNSDLIRKRHRVFLTGLDGDRFRWGKKIGGKDFTIPLYGMWKCNFTKPTVYLVEGESDLQTLYYLGLNALSLPSATVYKDSLHAGFLKGFDDIYVILDSDKNNRLDVGSSSLRKILLKSELKDKLRFMVLDGYKDVSKLFRVTNDKKKAVEVIMENRNSDQEILEPLKKEDTKADVSPFNGKYFEEIIDVDINKDDGFIGFPSLPLGNPLGDMIRETSRFCEAPEGLAFGLGISVISACLKGKIAVQYPSGFSEPIVIWTITSMLSGERKSPVFDKMLDPIKDHESYQKQSMRVDIAVSKATFAREKNQIAKIQKDSKISASEAMEKIKEIEQNRTEVLIAPAYTCRDITNQKLNQEVIEQDGSMGLFIDEASEAIGNMGGMATGHSSNMDIFLSGYSGGEINIKRASSDIPDQFIDAGHLSIGFAIQPQPLSRFISNKEWLEKGLFGRFWFINPIRSDKKFYNNQKPIDENIVLKYKLFIQALLSQNFGSRDKNKRLVRDNILLSKEADNLISLYHNETQKEITTSGTPLSRIVSWGQKLTGRTTRLAGIIHISENPINPTKTELSKDTMALAIKFSREMTKHAVFTFGEQELDPDLEKAQKIVLWLKKNKRSSFTKRDIMRGNRKLFQKTIQTKDPLMILGERNYISGEFMEQNWSGRKTDIFGVNPAIYKDNI